MFTTEIPCKHTERRIAPLEMQFEKCTAKIMSKRPTTVVSCRQTLPSLTVLAFGSHPPIRLPTLYYIKFKQNKNNDKATLYFSSSQRILHVDLEITLLLVLVEGSSSEGAEVFQGRRDLDRRSRRRRRLRLCRSHCRRRSMLELRRLLVLLVLPPPVPPPGDRGAVRTPGGRAALSGTRHLTNRRTEERTPIFTPNAKTHNIFFSIRECAIFFLHTSAPPASAPASRTGSTCPGRAAAGLRGTCAACA